MASKDFPEPRDWMQANPEMDLFDYLEEFGSDAWNEKVSPMFRRTLEEDNWPKGAPLIYMAKNSDRIVFEYRDGRRETEFVNELFPERWIDGRGDRFLTTCRLISSIGNKCFVDGKYGMIVGISDHLESYDKTTIGDKYFITVEWTPMQSK